MEKKSLLRRTMSQAIKVPMLTQHILFDIDFDQELERLVEKYKDSSLTPLEMDLKIQGNRVIYCLNKCLAKFEVLAFLPYLLEDNGKILRKYYSSTECAVIFEICNRFEAQFDFKLSEDKYTEFLHELELINPDAYDSAATYRQKSSMTVKVQALDFNAIQLIDKLFYNNCIQAEIRNAKEPNFDLNVMKIIHILQDFRDIIKEKIYITGDEEKAIEKKLRRTYKTNLLLVNTVKELKKKLEEQRRQLGQQLDNSLSGFQMYIDKMDEVKDKFKFKMANTLHNSEKSMMRKSLESEEVQEQLSEEADNLVKEYENLLAGHLREEKAQRAKRLKLEAQLQNWLNTFDQDVGEKYAEYEVLKKEFDDMNDEKETLENEMDEQEEEYLALMEEKRVEEERLYQEMAYQYLLNRSARTIQNYWRAYRIRKMSKKKGKKGKGAVIVMPPRPAQISSISKSVVFKEEDPLALLSSDKKMKSHVFEELKDPRSPVFSKQNLVVDLEAEPEVEG